MAGWRATLKSAYERLRDWRRIGAIDEHAWVLGMHVLSAMHELKTTGLHVSMSHFANAFIHCNGKPIVGPVVDIDLFYIGALQALHTHIGIYNDVSEERLMQLIGSRNEPHTYENAHFTLLFHGDPGHAYLHETQSLYFKVEDVDTEVEYLAHKTKTMDLYPQECPAWMTR